MQEFINLQNECLTRIESMSPNEYECSNDDYCQKHSCEKGDCTKCLHHIQWHSSPSFHYCCERITYYYVLRFFNRFSSEIAQFFKRLNLTKKEIINVISIGCGPASELYGILYPITQLQLPISINYKGYDISNIWNNIQKITKQNFSRLGHNIEFYNLDIFQQYDGFNNDEPPILLLNYLLSDFIKYNSKTEEKENFINNIISFIIENKIGLILLNDIRYYGYEKKVDSSIQLMKLIIKSLENKGVNCNYYFLCFEGDPCLGEENWHKYDDNRNLFPILKGNKFLENVKTCKSKQIVIKIL